ncbi:uncharacterized protein LOC135805785 isoform X2 [Sycon ciliatum]|uniref:uncharacterized protein LOC135805785 isoform X2 n=1 Tax=Sycon ciliatum TaxID=27933 RepID=UPI0020AC9CF7|eukprot:scpid84488/ scgid19901/ 
MTEDKGYSRETKERLTNAVEQEINEVGKLVKHLCKSSGTSEVLMRCAREFAGNDMGLQDTHENLKQMLTMVSQMHEQADTVSRSAQGVLNITRSTQSST